MSEETIQNQHAPLTTETIVGQAFLPVHLARRHAPLGRPVGTYLRDVPSSAPTYTVEYGHDGNMLTYGGWTFTWNGENRLINASTTTTTISNAYDYMGRRFSKVVNGVTNTFVYDGWAMIREESMTTTNHYVYGLDLSGSMQGPGTIGGILAADLNGTTAFYCYDANGNVTDLVGTNGSSVAHYEYDPFGNTIAQSGTLADENPFRFSTKYLDTETDLYYYGYRYYSPELGRFISRDPIAERGGQNLYAFVWNQPTLRYDLHGRTGSPSYGDVINHIPQAGFVSSPTAPAATAPDSTGAKIVGPVTVDDHTVPIYCIDSAYTLYADQIGTMRIVIAADVDDGASLPGTGLAVTPSHGGVYISIEFNVTYQNNLDRCCGCVKDAKVGWIQYVRRLPSSTGDSMYVDDGSGNLPPSPSAEPHWMPFGDERMADYPGWNLSASPLGGMDNDFASTLRCKNKIDASQPESPLNHKYLGRIHWKNRWENLTSPSRKVTITCDGSFLY
jgi:RHS repeat-associated protein